MTHVTIVSGISGSGKTRHVKFLSEMDRRRGKITAIISYHQFFKGNEEDRFDVNKREECHINMIRRYIELIQSRKDIHIIVDKFNLTVMEISPFYYIAKAFGINVAIATMICKPAIAAQRSNPQVSIEIVEQMAEILSKRRIPKFWLLSSEDYHLTSHD